MEDGCELQNENLYECSRPPQYARLLYYIMSLYADTNENTPREEYFRRFSFEPHKSVALTGYYSTLSE